MISILIADDEKLIRAGLIKIIKDSFSVPIKILEAKNGKEALEIYEKEEPSLIITDIKMPVMDGIELMTALQNFSQKPQIIVLSGFDDFSFAKAAIQNGALTYILKPVDKKELISAINKAIGISMKDEKKHTEELLKSIMDEGPLAVKQEEVEFDFGEGAYYVSVYGVPARELTDLVLKGQSYYIVEEKRDFVGLLYSFKGEEVVFDKEILNRILVGVSERGTNFSQLRTLRKQSMTALLQEYFSGENGLPVEKRKSGMYFYSEPEEKIDFDGIEEKYTKLAANLSIMTAEEIQKSVKNLLNFKESTANANAVRLYFIYGKIISDLFVRYASLIEGDFYLPSKSVLVEDFSTHENLDDWISCVMDVLIYLGEILKKNTSEYPYIAEAIEYIKKHFTKNINMAIVANQVSVNYTWFSEKFKEHTGINFNDYLKRMRIEEAKRLLEKDCYKVYEVAERSGFTDVKYFMKMFRKMTGMSPTEWAARHHSDSL